MFFTGRKKERVSIKMEMSKKMKFREYMESIAVAVILALLIRTFIIQAFKIPSSSMENTLKVGDHILVVKFLYGTHIPYTDLIGLSLKKPSRKEVIVFKYPLDPSRDFIKRCIGLPEKVLRFGIIRFT